MAHQAFAGIAAASNLGDVVRRLDLFAPSTRSAIWHEALFMRSRRPEFTDSAFCMSCKRAAKDDSRCFVRRGSKNGTSSLRQHLRCHHKDMMDLLLKAEADIAAARSPAAAADAAAAPAPADAAAAASGSSSPVGTATKKPRKNPSSVGGGHGASATGRGGGMAPGAVAAASAGELADATADWLATTLQPTSIVDHPRFARCIDIASAKTVPAPPSWRLRDIVAEKGAMVVARVREAIRGQLLAVVLMPWEDCAKQPHLSVSAQWLDASFVLRRATLGCRALRFPPVTTDVAALVHGILAEARIESQNVVALVAAAGNGGGGSSGGGPQWLASLRAACKLLSDGDAGGTYPRAACLGLADEPLQDAAKHYLASAGLENVCVAATAATAATAACPASLGGSAPGIGAADDFCAAFDALHFAMVQPGSTQGLAGNGTGSYNSSAFTAEEWGRSAMALTLLKPLREACALLGSQAEPAAGIVASTLQNCLMAIDHQARNSTMPHAAGDALAADLSQRLVAAYGESAAFGGVKPAQPAPPLPVTPAAAAAAAASSPSANLQAPQLENDGSSGGGGGRLVSVSPSLEMAAVLDPRFKRLSWWPKATRERVRAALCAAARDLAREIHVSRSVASAAAAAAATPRLPLGAGVDSSTSNGDRGRIASLFALLPDVNSQHFTAVGTVSMPANGAAAAAPAEAGAAATAATVLPHGAGFDLGLSLAAPFSSGSGAIGGGGAAALNRPLWDDASDDEASAALVESGGGGGSSRGASSAAADALQLRLAVHRAEEEALRYLREAPLPTNGDPLAFWHDSYLLGAAGFPTLCRLARRYLTLPATAAELYRAFGGGGHNAAALDGAALANSVVLRGSLTLAEAWDPMAHAFRGDSVPLRTLAAGAPAAPGTATAPVAAKAAAAAAGTGGASESGVMGTVGVMAGTPEVGFKRPRDYSEA